MVESVPNPIATFVKNHGVADTILGLFGVPAESKFSSDRLWSVAVAALGVFAALTGQPPGPIVDQVIGALGSLWSGANQGFLDVSLILGAFGLGRSAVSARSF